MIQLQAKSDDTWYELDVPEGVSIPLTYRFADPGELVRRLAPYSGTFTLPFTNTNNSFFGHWYKVDLVNASFDTNTAVPCRLLADGLQVLTGTLQLRSVSLVDDSYECNVLGGAGDLFSQMGNTKLASVLTEDFTYSPTATNVTDSWGSNDITNGGVGVGVVRVPLMDVGTTPTGHFYADSGVSAGLYEADFLKPERMPPILNIDYVFRAIMSHFGYSLTSAFFDTTAWLDLYFSTGGQNGGVTFRPFYGAKVGLSFDQFLAASQSGGSYTANPIQLNDTTSGGFYDPDGLMNNDVPFGFRAIGDLQAVFRVGLHIQNIAAGGVSSGNVFITNNGVEVWSQSVQVGAFSTDPDTIVVYDTPPLTLQSGDSLRVYWYHTNYNQGNLILKDNASTYFEFVSYASTSTGAGAVDPIAALPDITCASFVRDLVQRFNLTLIPNPSDPLNIQLEPLSDYLGSGQTLDWTSKVDHDKPFLVKPATELRSKKVQFSDGVDKDAPNEFHQYTFGQPLGQYTFTSEDQFASGVSKNDALFGSIMATLLPKADWSGTDNPYIVFPRLWSTQDGVQSPVETKPKLMYWNGTRSTGVDTIFIGGTEKSFYGQVTQFQFTPVLQNALTLQWNVTSIQAQASIWIGQNVGEGFVKKYWSEYLNSVYSPNARVVDCNVNLDVRDINELSFDDRVFISGVYYRVIEVSGYTAENASTKVRLQKLLEDEVVFLYPENECELTLSSLGTNGTSNWVDANGDAANPTQQCCEAAGYTFSDGQCWWQFNGGDTGPGDPDPPVNPGDEDDDGNGGDGGVTPFSLYGNNHMIQNTTLQPLTKDLMEESARGTSLPRPPMGKALYGRHKGTGIGGSTQRYQLMAETTNNTALIVAGPKGDSSSQLVVPDNTLAEFHLNCVGCVYAANVSSGASFGDSVFVEQSVVIRNFGGTTSVVANTNRQTEKDTGLGTPVISMGSSRNAERRTFESQYEVLVQGLEDMHIGWVIEVDVTYINVTSGILKQNGLTLENNEFILCENQFTLTTEQG